MSIEKSPSLYIIQNHITSVIEINKLPLNNQVSQKVCKETKRIE